MPTGSGTRYSASRFCRRQDAIEAGMPPLEAIDHSPRPVGPAPSLRLHCRTERSITDRRGWIVNRAPEGRSRRFSLRPHCGAHRSGSPVDVYGFDPRHPLLTRGSTIHNGAKRAVEANAAAYDLAGPYCQTCLSPTAPPVSPIALASSQNRSPWTTENDMSDGRHSSKPAAMPGRLVQRHPVEALAIELFDSSGSIHRHSHRSIMMVARLVGGT